MSKQFRDRRHDTAEERDVMDRQKLTYETQRECEEDFTRQGKDKRDIVYDKNGRHPNK